MSNYNENIRNISFDSVFAEDVYLFQVFSYYNKCYMSNKDLQNLVESSSYIGEEVKEGKMVGYCNRSLFKHIPSKRSFSGGAMRGALQRVGIIKPTGHELFRGCVVSPQFNSDGQIISSVGYRVVDRLSRWETRKVQWKRKSVETLLCESMSLISGVIHDKALTWSNGFDYPS